MLYKILRQLYIFFVCGILIICLTGVAPNPYSGVQVGYNDELLLHFLPGTPDVEAVQILASQGLFPVEKIPELGIWIVRPAAGKALVSLAALKNIQDVAWVEPNGWVYATGITPNDNFFQSQQYSLPLIGAPDAWVFGDGAGVVVGVLDSGVMVNHPDLSQSLWINSLEIPNNGLDDDGNGYIDDVNGFNFVGDIDSPLIGDQNSHGTHVAGIIAAQTNNTIGIAGVAGGAKLQIVKVLNSAGTGTYVDVIQGIIYAANNGAKILNFSLGGPNDGSNEIPLSLHEAVLYAQSKGCLMVASAGNETIAGVLYPAAFPEVLAVTASDASGAPFFSRFGPEVDINAPGVDILSPAINGSYGTFSGTSAAAPHVSGAAALVWALRPSLSAEEVMNLLESTAHDLYSTGWDPYTGAGRVDALNRSSDPVQSCNIGHRESAIHSIF